MSTPPGPCRLHCLVARETPVAVVFRRRPSHTWHILKWDLANDRLESGAWMNGSLYPERCAVSPDGKLLGYFALQAYNHWESIWHSFFAISKVPWLTALAAWRTCGTYTTGSYFERPDALVIGGAYENPPDVGAFPGVVRNIQMWPHQSLIEAGWQARESPPEQVSLTIKQWNEFWQTLELRRPQPVGGWTLFQKPYSERFALESFDTGRIELSHVRWADWDHRSRLLVATHDGHLQAHNMRRWPDSIEWEADLNPIEWQDVKSPEWARHW